MYEFIGDLSESRLIPSKSNLRQYTAHELADLAVLNLCALYILWNNPSTAKFARDYAKKTVSFGGKFGEWHTNATDLYVLIHALESNKQELSHPDQSNHFRSNLPLGETILVHWLREMAADKVTSNTHRQLFIKLDFNFRTDNQSIRAIRRLVMEWTDLDRREHELAMTRLLQFMRSRASRGELLGKLQKVANKHDLELKDVNNPEEDGASNGPVHTHIVIDPPKEKKSGGGFLTTLAGLAAGAAISGAIHKK